MPVWGEPWMGGGCEWPLEDRAVSAAVNPIYAHGASGFSFQGGVLGMGEVFHVMLMGVK